MTFKNSIVISLIIAAIYALLLSWGFSEVFLSFLGNPETDLPQLGEKKKIVILFLVFGPILVATSSLGMYYIFFKILYKGEK